MDQTPAVVRTYRINAIGFALSTFAILAGVAWWLDHAFPEEMARETGVFWVFGATALASGFIYLLPAFVPRKPWGYAVGWVALLLTLVSGSGTLPTLGVLLGFGKPEVKAWFDGDSPDLSNDKPATRMQTAIIVYYILVTIGGFGVISLLPDSISDPVEDLQPGIAEDVG